jgi:hypothetical protein
MDNPDHVLPESDAATFTALVDRYFDDRAALDDPPPGTEVNLALSRPVKASAELPDGPASAAVDGDGDTSWNAGAGPPAWIQIDLGVPVAVGRIVLTVAQSPNGQTIHIVSGRVGDGESNLALGGLAGNTTDNQRLVVEVAPSMPPLRYLRIDTTTSPSWVAWREIEVIPRAP